MGEGYSSPVVANGRAFLHSRRDPEEIVTAIDLATGAIVWQQKYTAAFTKNQYATQMAKGPNSTPLVAGTRLFTLGVTGILTAWNTADGTVAWRHDYSASIDTSKLFCGTALTRPGGAWTSKQLWKNADVTMDTVSPVFVDGVIYGMSNKRRGQFVAIPGPRSNRRREDLLELGASLRSA